MSEESSPPNTPVFAWLRNHVCTPREGLPEWFVKKFEQENNPKKEKKNDEQ